MDFELGLDFGQAVGLAIPEAPPYVPPEEEGDPLPNVDPESPTDTPTDPETEEPEPGIDPGWTAPNRIELDGDKQGATRLPVEENTWGNVYVASPLAGFDYWEIHIAASTPRNATVAIGVTDLTLPLNGIPGDLPGTLAYWSNGDIRSNASAASGFAAWGRNDKLMIARDRDTGRIWFGKNCSWLASTPAVGGGGHQGALTGNAPYHAFAGFYSTDSRGGFKFVSSKFACAIPAGFYPIGRTPGPALLLSSADELDPPAKLLLSGTAAPGSLSLSEAPAP